jgi:hypothetical protein
VAKRAPRVATAHNAVKEMIKVHLNLVHVFHAYDSTNPPWVAHALSHFTPIRYGRISSVSAAHGATHFAGPIKSRMRQYTTQTYSLGPNDWSLNDTCRGYHLEALNFRSDHSSSFLSSILLFSLFAPSGL